MRTRRWGCADIMLFGVLLVASVGCNNNSDHTDVDNGQPDLPSPDDIGSPTGDPDLPSSGCAPEQLSYGDVCFEVVRLDFGAQEFASKDIDGDGAWEIVALDRVTQTLHLLNVEGLATENVSSVATGSGMRLSVGAFVEPGETHVAVTKSGGIWLHGIQDSTLTEPLFDEPEADPVWKYESATVIGPFSNGLDRLVATAEDNQLRLAPYEFDGAQWTSGVHLEPAGCVHSHVLNGGDFDGDGSADPLASFITGECGGYPGSENPIATLLVQGDDTVSVVPTDVGQWLQDVIAGEFDENPGANAVAQIGSEYLFFEGKGNGTMEEPEPKSVENGELPFLKSAADLDGDGQDELIATSQDGEMFVISNPASPGEPELWRSNSEFALVGTHVSEDFNGDQIDDLLATTPVGSSSEIVLILSTDGA